ncbi:hypothetical protein ACFHWD_16290 [Clostridium sp. MT-14]|uniref:hypothetical protein n=1 Tax=Clostridium sp. MT-14 TaxID=3348360 RepID=UPI0035F3C83B
MQKSEFKIQLDKLRRQSRKKWIYFCWKNKVNNISTKFSEMTEEDILEKYPKLIYPLTLKIYKTRWEQTEEYQNLYRLLMQIRSQQDLYKIYEVVKDKALKGDDKAIKTFLLLKKEIWKSPIEKSGISPEDSQEENKDDLDISED